MFIEVKVSVSFSKNYFAEKVGEKIGKCLQLVCSCKDAKTISLLCKDCEIMQKITLLIRPAFTVYAYHRCDNTDIPKFNAVEWFPLLIASGIGLLGLDGGFRRLLLLR